MSETNGLNGHREEIHWPSLIAAISAISAVGIAIGLGLPLLSIMNRIGLSDTFAAQILPVDLLLFCQGMIDRQYGKEALGPDAAGCDPVFVKSKRGNSYVDNM